ncbi:MAG: ACT domain-containing protein [Candidatus Micrarchaeia archaeon]|jgi:hypothetical protein
MAAKNLLPSLSDGKYFVGTFPEAQMMGLAGYLQHIICIFREDEGLTVVFSENAKSALEIYTDKKMQGPFALITLRAPTSLLDVGITAAFSSALAREKIPANVYAGYCHDHVLVPYDKRGAALQILQKP